MVGMGARSAKRGSSLCASGSLLFLGVTPSLCASGSRSFLKLGSCLSFEGAFSDDAVLPTHWFPVTVRHHAVKLFGGSLEHQWQKIAIAFPERERQNPLDVDPFQGAF